jgi:hypothetical protein
LCLISFELFAVAGSRLGSKQFDLGGRGMLRNPADAVKYDICRIEKF